MESLADVKLGLCEDSEPTKFEWALAFVLFMIPFMSFFYGDTACFIMYELRFAQAILHGNLREAYDPVVKLIAANGVSISSMSVYDLPLNLIFGIWGIPLYLYASRNGSIEYNFPESFWQMLYGKSILLLAFILSAVMVYKVCITLGLTKGRSRWGAYIYFTSSMAIAAIGMAGQCDVIAVCIILKGFLEYIRGNHKKFFLWFIIAIQFKQFAFFLFVPLMLLADKNLLRAAGRLIIVFAVTLLCNLPIAMLGDISVRRAGFTTGMFGKLVTDRLPLFHGNVSVVLLLLGAFCIYCWFHEYKDKADKSEVNSQVVFSALASMIILFTSFPSYPYWYVHLIPYLAISAVYYADNTDKILLFETVGIAAVVFFNYGFYDWVYSPNNAINMMIHNILGNPEIARLDTSLKIKELLPSALKFDTAALATMIIKGIKKISFLFETIYVLSMYSVLRLSYPHKYLTGGGGARYYIRLRLLFNTLIAYFPIILFFMAVIRR